MRLLLLITIITSTSFAFSQEFKDYELQPYNKEFRYKLIDENTVVDEDDSLEALIIIFKHPVFENAQLSFRNNPQLKEIKLFMPNQEIIKFISENNLQSLTYLFIERYGGNTLEIPSFPGLEHLTIKSSTLESLNMVNAALDKVIILDIEAPKLTEWKTSASMPNVELINLQAQLLSNFPIEQMPKIFEFMFSCSFKVLPNGLCDYSDLRLISFTNYAPLIPDDCLITKIENCVYSNLTIYNKIDGEKIHEILSKDQIDK